MVCYRKYGHNEGDEPKYTQPHLYGLVAKHKNPRDVYRSYLMEQGKGELADLVDEMQRNFKDLLSDRFNNVKEERLPSKNKGPHKEWEQIRWSKPEDFLESPDTSVKKEVLEKTLAAITSSLRIFKVLRKAQKILDERKNALKRITLDWAICEMFAFGAILQQRNHVRFSGQDVIRGTFSHRHAKVFDEYTNEPYCGLDHIQQDQGRMYIYNSLLSEYAVLGFEYGYSQATSQRA